MFKSNKYTRWYYKIVNHAQSSERVRLKRTNPSFVYYESHHIVPKSMGGVEEVLLTAKEHYICHLLLPRMLEGRNKHLMINALIKMAFAKSNGQERYKAKSFSVVRSMMAEKNSEMFKGKPKSEKTRQRMKGRSGKWERTEEHRKALSNTRKGKYCGKDNHFYGKTHTKESIEQRTKSRREKYNGFYSEKEMLSATCSQKSSA